MNLLINLIPIKKGGGQQVASNFINQILKDETLSLFFLTTENTYIHKLLTEKKTNFTAVRNGLIARLKFQSFSLPNIVKQNNIDVIYTMFGPGLHMNKTISITGSAYSNIYFPEIDFWKGYSSIQKLKLKLIDFYRLKSTLKSDAIVFENEAMLKRAHSIYNYPLERTKLILPSISEYEKIKDDTSGQVLQSINSDKFNIVFLTGWHKNKNIEILPKVLEELKKQGFTDVSFLISVPKSHPNSIKLVDRAKEIGVDENIVFLDTIAPHNIPILFKKIDGVGLFSLLESFSNNIIEAWYFNKPLFISDAEWSKGICKKAAVYVDRDSPSDIAAKIIDYKSNKKHQENLKLEMKEILKEYPTPKEKVELQIEFIKKIYNEISN